MKKINWGIIGPGKIAQKFADDLRLLPDATLHAVASRNAERSRAFADRYGAPYAFDNYEALAECPDLDVVYIATPHTFHAAHTLLMLQQGIAVLCEKPFAMNYVEAEQMVNTARQQQVFLMEAFWTRFIPGIQQAFEWIAEGRIGTVQLVEADFGFKTEFDPQSRLFNIALGGGSLLDIGIYPAWLALQLLGQPTTKDIQSSATFSPTGSDISCSFSFTYPDGTMARGLSTVAVNTPTEARIYGDKGTLHLHNRWHHPHQISLGSYEGKTQAFETFHFPYEGWGYHFEAEHVGTCLRAGLTESPFLPLQKTLELTATLDAIQATWTKPNGVI
jgi:predicted dehydrogenase